MTIGSGMRSSLQIAGLEPDVIVAAAKHQRVDGLARIQFKAAPEGGTRLAELYQRAPCRVLFPATDSGEPLEAVLLTTSGGLTGGDRTRVDIELEAGAHATITTQAAEKLYRALPDAADTCMEIGLRVANGGWAEWLAQETILFDGAKLRRTVLADVAAQGRLLAVESTVFGRTAMGERFSGGRLHDAWRIRRDGRLIWADALHLEGDIRALQRAPFGFGTAVACSTVVYVGPDAADQLLATRELIDRHTLPAAATGFDGLLVIRLLADDAAALRAAVMTVTAAIRHSAGGYRPRMPRVWYC
jgi:urease accessory protein